MSLGSRLLLFTTCSVRGNCPGLRWGRNGLWSGRRWRGWFIDILPYSATNNPYEKRGDNEPVCIADEVPFEIPESWEWCRLSIHPPPINLVKYNLLNYTSLN